VKARGGTVAAQNQPSTATSADTAGAAQRASDDRRSSVHAEPERGEAGNQRGVAFRQCHDITVYPQLGLAGGACEGHGFLLDVSNPGGARSSRRRRRFKLLVLALGDVQQRRNEDPVLDEWGGGGAAKCRAGDPKEFGADAIFTIGPDKKLHFQSYYKLPSIQTDKENCVAHNGSLIPIPGRDVMIQARYQGGISVFDFTDPKHPFEIAYFDRGPIQPDRFSMGGSWSAYWYNGQIISSEIARGLDVADMVPTQYVSQNEIDAAKTVHLDQLNVQGSAEAGVAAELLALQGVRGPARAQQVSVVVAHRGCPAEYFAG
jgi:hypothetical protein